MAHWIIIPIPGKMPDLLGPFSGFRAQQEADRLDVPYEIVQTVSSNEARAKQEMKLEFVLEKGHKEGSRNIKKAVTTIGEKIGGRKEDKSLERQQDYKSLLRTRRPAHIVHERSRKD